MNTIALHVSTPATVLTGSGIFIDSVSVSSRAIIVASPTATLTRRLRFSAPGGEPTLEMFEDMDAF